MRKLQIFIVAQVNPGLIIARLGLANLNFHVMRDSIAG